MTTFKKTMTTAMATVLLIQSVLPMSLFASELPAATRTSIDTRLATIDITDKYNSLMKYGDVSISDALNLAARLYAVMIGGPSCEHQASTADATRVLSKTAGTTYQGFAQDKNYAENTAGVTSIAPICTEIFSEVQKDPSVDLLRIYEKFFATFFPGVDFNTFMQAMDENEDPDAYITSTLTAAQIQRVYTYLDTKQIPNTQSCSLTAADEASYMQAKTQYIAATNKGEAALAEAAFDSMNQIQSRVVCSDGVVQGTTPRPTLNPECVNKVSILMSQQAALQSDPVSYQQDIARIQKSIDTITQSADCSLNTKRTQLPAISGLGKTPRLTTDVLQFETATPTVIPNVIPPFCQSTASTLGTQLETASYFTVNKLIETISDMKGDLGPQQQSIATLVQALAVDKAAIKAQNLGLTNPSNAMHRFVNILEMLANNILSNAAMYNLVDLAPLMEMYSDAIDQTSLGMADTFAALQKILDTGARFVWNEGNKSFQEEKSSNPGVTFLARSNENSQTNDMSVVIKELSAFQFKEWTQEEAYSTKVTESAPTLQDLTDMYFGSQSGEPTAYDNTRNNRVWYAVSPSATTTISDANYRALSASRRYYNYIAVGNLAVEVVDVNGGHIAIVPDHVNRVVRYLEEGVYSNEWQTIEVGANGQAVILHEDHSTYPSAIDLAGSIDGNLKIAIKGNIKWPENIAPFIQKTAEEVFTATRDSGMSLFAEDGLNNKDGTVVSATSKAREEMLPEEISGELFFSPNLLKFKLNRTYNPENGTNTITLKATLVGGTTCGFDIDSSVTYRGNQYGISQEDGNPVTHAQFSIGTDSYKFEASSQYINDIIQQVESFINEEGESDITSLINEKVVNNLSVLGTSFGSLIATQEGINVLYPNGEAEDLLEIVMPVLEKMDLGRLGQFIDFAEGENGKGKEQTDPNQEQVYVDTYSADQNYFMISFIGDSGNLIYPTTSPILYVDSCFDTCQTYEYPMDLNADGSYSYTIPSEVYEQSTYIYMQADHNGYGVYHQFM